MPIVDLATGQIAEEAHPKTSPDHIFVQGTLANDAIASIASRKAQPGAADKTGWRWYITGTEGELVIKMEENQWQFANASTKRSLKLLRAGQTGAEDVDFTADEDLVQSQGANAARAYKSFLEGSEEVATFDSALKLHKLLDRIAKSAGWSLEPKA